VGWYFVPVANLWKPYQAMKEIWKASSDPENWQDRPVSPLLPWWWLLCVVSSIIGQCLPGSSLNLETLDEIIFFNILSQIYNILYIALILVFLAIMKRIHEMQTSRFLNRI